MTQRNGIQKHTIIALVEDRPGVLNRIASKWRQRGFNIESLAVGHSETPGLSRMTFAAAVALATAVGAWSARRHRLP